MKTFLSAAILLATCGVAFAVDKIGMAEEVQISATVKAIDVAKRQVTLHDRSGKHMVLTVDDIVQNLPQVAVGDKVSMVYAHRIVVGLTKSSKTMRERGESEAFKRADKGEKPSGMLSRQTTVTASIEAIDRKHHFVTLRGPRQTVEVDIPDMSLLDNLKKGDFVDAVYDESLTIKVEGNK